MKILKVKCQVLLLLLLSISFLHAQQESKRLAEFEAACIRLTVKVQPDSMMIVINRFSQNGDLNAIEIQKLNIWESQYYKLIGRYQDAVNCCLKA
ncbi:MAG: hypothetical protein V4535_10475, partial [Bacteroidota bacterium]